MNNESIKNLEAAQRLYREWFENKTANGVLSDIANDVGKSVNKRDKFSYR